MSRQNTYYWDSCCWIGLLNQERGKYPALSAIWQQAKEARCRILTSTISKVEVLKKRCDDQSSGSLSDQNNSQISTIFQQSHVVMANVDQLVAGKAAELRIRHPELRKTPDAIHLATAVYWNCDAMHTYDQSDLLCLNGKIQRRDGILLDIETPDKVGLGPLFSQYTSEHNKKS
ncbi:MAG: type II toxin-antitoxin system VapC family toxin [Bryobacterales bacterium]|nr:type II toxin-antitoxin system VapC family toxin [Bryobacterales bacterium]